MKEIPLKSYGQRLHHTLLSVHYSVILKTLQYQGGKDLELFLETGCNSTPGGTPVVYRGGLDGRR